MSQFEDSATYIFVANVDSGFTDDTSVLADLDAREVQFFTQAGVTQHSAITSSAVKHYVAGKNTAGVIHKSPLFVGNTIKNATYAVYDAPVEQISYLGYNGVLDAGAMDAVAGYYSISIILNHTFGLLNNSPLIKTLPYKMTTGSQSNLAFGLTDAGITSFKREPLKAVKFERVNSGAQLVDLNNLALVNGARTFLSADDDTLSILVGSIVRVEEPESGGEDVDDPCYIVVSHDSGVGAARIYTLDVPFQGVTNADHDHAGTVTEGDWGIKMTGVSVADAAFNPVVDTPFMVNFDISKNDRFTTADIATSTESFIGMGSYQTVAGEEAYTQFQIRGKQVEAYPPTPNLTFEADASSTYNVVEFEASDQEYSSATTGQNPKSKFRIKLYALDSTVDTDLALWVTTVGATTVDTKA